MSSSSVAGTAQFYLYDDFILSEAWMGTQPVGAYPGNWVASGTLSAAQAAGGQNGIISFPATGAALVGNFNASVSGTKWPIPYGNIIKIVFRAVFRITATFSGGQNEITFGFTHTGAQGADGSGNLYGAFINYCPGYTGLSDWDTRAAIAPASMTGFTYGCYGGTTTGMAGLGYKLSTLVPTLNVNQYYDTIISMIPGVSCTFYAAPYGTTPALDRKCTVAANLPAANLTPAGPIPYVGCTSSSSLTLLDKIEYAIWTTEGNKYMGGNVLNGY